MTATIASPPRRAWATSGVLAGVAGAAVFVASTGLAASEDALADNAVLLDELQGTAAWAWAFQVATSVAALCLTVFGVGLRRRLDEQEPVGSLAANLAMVGLLLAAGLSLVGGGISTQLFWWLQADAGDVDPDTVAADLEIYATLGWVWAGVGLAAGVVAWAGLTHESVGRRLAWFSAVVAGLIALTQLLPVQYMAIVPGALWCLVAGVAFARGA
ncbi:MAG TPA: hypothetical protein VIL36_08525 [Acidimicrobiales bacterium]